MTSMQDLQKRSDLDLKAGADVYTAEGDRVGSIERVVLDPETLRATHLVVEKGLLFTKDRLVPVDDVGVATPERITLDPDLDMDALEKFEVERYIPIDPASRSGREHADYRAMLAYPPLSMTPTMAPPTTATVIERNISDRLIALEAGAEVTSHDGKVVGSLERVLTADDFATHVVVETPGPETTLKAIPAGWIAELFESGVSLSVEGWIVDELPDYEPRDA
jgi:hypothetical protein